ncbi:hypothetical protein ACHQM5_002550 [Ranunculus cassubicifolius]
MISPNPFSLCCAILLCFPLALVFTSINTTTTTNTVVRRSSPPPTLVLPRDDESLFRLASRVNSQPTPTKRIAFMFLTTTALPFAPLWELFFRPNGSQFTANSNNLFNIYIHADPNSTTHYNFNNTPVFTNRVIHSKSTQRRTPSLIAATRRLLAHALLHDSSNAMFALLSPSCIPLHSFNFTYTTLTASHKSFIEILKDEPGAIDRWEARGVDIMLPQVPFRSFRVGSQFFVLTRRHAKLAVRDHRLWRKFKLPCVRRDVCYPEEHYFPTLMSMMDPRGCVPATLTHVDWSGRSDGHPRTYNADVIGPEFIVKLRRDRPRYGDDGLNVSDQQQDYPFLFARKFAPDTLQPLMTIANDVIFSE